MKQQKYRNNLTWIGPAGGATWAGQRSLPQRAGVRISRHCCWWWRAMPHPTSRSCPKRARHRRQTSNVQLAPSPCITFTPRTYGALLPHRRAGRTHSCRDRCWLLNTWANNHFFWQSKYINIKKIPITLSLCINKMSENIKNAHIQITKKKSSPH
jgi:hypothetical protein